MAGRTSETRVGSAGINGLIVGVSGPGRGRLGRVGRDQDQGPGPGGLPGRDGRR